MIKKLLWSLFLFGAVLVVLLQIPPSQPTASQPASVLELLNEPVPGHANLISIQPFMTVYDYSDADLFARKLRGYLLQAQQADWLTENSLVVLPEHIGTWLVAEGEGFPVFASERADVALLWAALGNLPGFVKSLWGESARDPFAAALFKSKSVAMAAQYQQVFTRLAQDFGVTLVAGSIVLPDPRIQDGQILPGKGPLYNSSFLFYPDGAVAGPVRKVYPIDSELPFTQAASQELPVFDTRLGRLAILICADSWYPDTWQQVATADLVAVPSFASPDGIWEMPWGGYNGAAAPADVDPADVGKLREGAAWRKYALAGRGGSLRAGINTFMRGDLWDLGDDGRTTAVLQGAVIQGQRRDGAVISSLWLP
ncbi:carbon-nitrogen hydrolase family protein [Microbulbifer hydrolyticus]|uniref:Carbon-nitrogen hydrolase family protein n=1 Tax=Microbulbifer hydrolyticus TaxID=48074 RepID=A0A6P1T7A0_9GAMM|nr:carbon-nitrogen hydrolase family protein [Microbulbifer hydrolyticus]MBB5210880.1 hypothetical protein [Microbulbifer hydrolyticus]QHQ38694.1 carbon-nitrogen hydrolase family protein [Microbulbifer hydrolyticus]